MTRLKKLPPRKDTITKISRSLYMVTIGANRTFCWDLYSLTYKGAVRKYNRELRKMKKTPNVVATYIEGRKRDA